MLIGTLISCLLLGCSNDSVDENSSLRDDPSAAGQDTTITVTPVQLEAYLTNPGIGWQDGPESFGIMNFPETVDYANRRLIAWSKLNPAEGVYDWSALDAQLNEAVAQGKQFSFRIYTYVGEGYDGSMIPDWVINKGAALLASGEPDYSNCIYQETWGQFVTELVRVYDGHSNIAFIDISGYGDFNEWSWKDEQTEWDEQWMVDYENGNPSSRSIQTIDGQARRRLADMFIGGSFDRHSCRTASGETHHVNYAYQGFQSTQLLMPYAGIVQSSQYVHSRRQDVGFRHDCLGRDGRALFDKIGDQINKVWKHAPIVYELCRPDHSDIQDIQWLLRVSHPSIVHNNQWQYSWNELQDVMMNIGYRFFLKTADLSLKDRTVHLEMEWQNIGSAPNYPKMGQEFNLYFYLVDGSGKPVFQDSIPVDTSRWLPASDVQKLLPGYRVTHDTQLPASLASGTYETGIAIIDVRTGKSIHLSFAGRDETGIYILSPITID